MTQNRRLRRRDDNNAMRVANRFAPLQPEHPPDWSELPVDLLPIVFMKLGGVDVLMTARHVCRSWREAAKAPEAWRRLDLEHHRVVRTKKQHVLRTMAKLAVDHSDGQIESFAGAGFVTDELLKYIAKRSSCLKRLSLSSCNVTDQGFLELVTKSPLLEQVSIYLCEGITGHACQVAPRVCPQLKRFMIQAPDTRPGRHMQHRIRTMIRFPKISFVAV